MEPQPEEAVYHSSGQFTLDPEARQRTLVRYRLPPLHFVLCLIQGGVLLGAGEVRIRKRSSELRVLFDAPLSPGEEQLLLKANYNTTLPHRALERLACGMLAARAEGYSLGVHRQGAVVELKLRPRSLLRRLLGPRLSIEPILESQTGSLGVPVFFNNDRLPRLVDADHVEDAQGRRFHFAYAPGRGQLVVCLGQVRVHEAPFLEGVRVFIEAPDLKLDASGLRASDTAAWPGLAEEVWMRSLLQRSPHPQGALICLERLLRQPPETCTPLQRELRMHLSTLPLIYLDHGVISLERCALKGGRFRPDPGPRADFPSWGVLEAANLLDESMKSVLPPRKKHAARWVKMADLVERQGQVHFPAPFPWVWDSRRRCLLNQNGEVHLQVEKALLYGPATTSTDTRRFDQYWLTLEGADDFVCLTDSDILALERGYDDQRGVPEAMEKLFGAVRP